jgi:hypothetical protein
MGWSRPASAATRCRRCISPLRQRMIEDMTVRNLMEKTRNDYLQVSVESITDQQSGIVLSAIGEASPAHWPEKTWCERPEADEFASALLSTGPHPDLAPEQQIFNPFIGSWNLLVTWYGEDGRATRYGRGESHFAWVLGGAPCRTGGSSDGARRVLCVRYVCRERIASLPAATLARHTAHLAMSL